MKSYQSIKYLFHESKHKLKSIGLVRKIEGKIGEKTQNFAIKNLGQQTHTYYEILLTYNKNIKKPNEDLKKIELETFKKLIDKADMKVWYFADFLQAIKHYRLTNEETLYIIEEWVSKLIKQTKLTNEFRLHAIPICQVLNFLVEQGKYEIWRQNSEMIERLGEKSQENKGQFLANYSYCDSIISKEFKEMNPEELKGLNCKKFRFEQKILQGLLFKDQPSNAGIDLKIKKRSLLQIEVQSLLRTLQLQFQRQVPVYNLFSVDFMLPQNKKEKQRILQVLGSHHYTINGQLRGRDIMRALLLNENYRVSFIHEKHLNGLKGVANKLNYIKRMRDLETINWE